jgi:hypothetical protein
MDSSGSGVKYCVHNGLLLNILCVVTQLSAALLFFLYKFKSLLLQFDRKKTFKKIFLEKRLFLMNIIKDLC